MAVFRLTSGAMLPNPSSWALTDFHRRIFESVISFTVPHIYDDKPDELFGIIRSWKIRQISGLDDIGNLSLKLLPMGLIQSFCNIINAITQLYYFPRWWKHVMVVYIHPSYRPINLLFSLRL